MLGLGFELNAKNDRSSSVEVTWANIGRRHTQTSGSQEGSEHFQRQERGLYDGWDQIDLPTGMMAEVGCWATSPRS